MSDRSDSSDKRRDRDDSVRRSDEYKRRDRDDDKYKSDKYRDDRGRDYKDRDRRDRDRDRDYKDRDRDYKDRERRDRDRDYRDSKDGRDKRKESEREDSEERDIKRRKDEDENKEENGNVASPMDTESADMEDKKKKVPMDVEDLLKKKKEEEEAQVKPKFLTREEREKLALERRAQAVAERAAKVEEQHRARDQFLQEAADAKRKETGSREGGRRDRDRDYKDREREREKEREKEKEREREKEKKNSGKEGETEKEIEMIKATYLGLKKDKKKIIKPSEKFKFVFDWDANEDTSKDINPLYNIKHDIRPQFGRGFIAGIDPKEQEKDYKKFLEIEKEKTGNEGVSKKLTTLEKAVLPSTHWSQKSLEQMSERDWRIFKEDFNITTKGGSIPNPLRSWKEAKFDKEVMDAVINVGYKDPTAIQRQAIPIALQGRDIMGIAETGSGKTAAFVLPMLQYILRLPKMTPENESDGPYAVIMAPSRELVQQIESETIKFASVCGLRCISLVGGVPIEQQALALRKGCEIIIATPGRLNDCLTSRYIVLNQCTYVVLDEADRMIDMGFEPQVNSILDAMPSSSIKSADEAEAAKQEGASGMYRTTIMYSATMPTGVERLSRKYLRRPAYVIIGEIGKAVDRIEQRVEWIKDENDKRRKLVEILTDGPPPPIMIFVNKKSNCDGISKQLEKLGWRATTLHGGRSQIQREAAIEGFRSGRYEILIATDVAGRGINVPGVTHVINYDMPKSIEDYTHRVGRTGRAGMSGLATTFVTNEDSEVLYDLKQMLISTNNFVPNELSSHPAAQTKPGTVPDKPTRRDTVIYAKT